jgi:Tfp pilus assembly protein PilF
MLSSTVKAWFLGLALSLAAVWSPHRVDAASHSSTNANTQRARRHFLAGKRAFEAKRYSVALKEFETGYAIDPRPGFLLNMGHAARRMGELRRARDYYLKFLESDPPAPERRSTIALVVELDRQLAAAPASGSHAQAAPEPAAVTPPPPAVAPPPVETAAAVSAVEPAPAMPAVAVAPEDEPPVETPPPRPRLHLEPAVAVRVTSRDDAPAATRIAPQTASAESAPPIYRRWWFWAGAGVAAGVVTAIAVGALGSGAAPRDSGTWGQIKL